MDERMSRRKEGFTPDKREGRKEDRQDELK